MYLYPERSHDETAENFDSSAYWCFHTMKSFGPNDDMVGGRECRDPVAALLRTALTVTGAVAT